MGLSGITLRLQEFVVLGRRVVYSLIAVLTGADVLSRVIAFGLLTLIMLIVHTYYYPFRDAADNAFETAFLSFLVAISLLLCAAVGTTGDLNDGFVTTAVVLLFGPAIFFLLFHTAVKILREAPRTQGRWRIQSRAVGIATRCGCCAVARWGLFPSRPGGSWCRRASRGHPRAVASKPGATSGGGHCC